MIDKSIDEKFLQIRRECARNILKRKKLCLGDTKPTLLDIERNSPLEIIFFNYTFRPHTFDPPPITQPID